MLALTNQGLVDVLKAKVPHTSLLNKLKIVYRPYICPFKELLEGIPPGSRIFDIGCGSGMFLMLVAEFKQPRQLGGVEIRPELIRNALSLLQTYRLPLDLSVYDGTRLPDVLSEYDHLFLIDVLHHVPVAQQAAFLEQVYAKMRPGSKLTLKDIDAARPVWCSFNKLHDLMLSGEIGHEWTFERALAECRRIGFELVSSQKKRTLVYPHYTLELVKR